MNTQQVRFIAGAMILMTVAGSTAWILGKIGTSTTNTGYVAIFSLIVGVVLAITYTRILPKD